MYENVSWFHITYSLAWIDTKYLSVNYFSPPRRSPISELSTSAWYRVLRILVTSSGWYGARHSIQFRQGVVEFDLTIHFTTVDSKASTVSGVPSHPFKTIREPGPTRLSTNALPDLPQLEHTVLLSLHTLSHRPFSRRVCVRLIVAWRGVSMSCCKILTIPPSTSAVSCKYLCAAIPICEYQPPAVRLSFFYPIPLTSLPQIYHATQKPSEKIHNPVSVRKWKTSCGSRRRGV